MSTPALVGNAADRKQVERARKTQARDRDQEVADMRSVLASPSGRRVLWHLLEDCKVFASIWHPSALIHFNEGRRDVGLKLMGAIARADDHALLQMMAEAADAGRRMTAEMARASKEDETP